MSLESLYGKVPFELFRDYAIAFYLVKMQDKTFEQKERMFIALDAFLLTSKKFTSVEYASYISEMCNTLRSYL